MKDLEKYLSNSTVKRLHELGSAPEERSWLRKRLDDLDYAVKHFIDGIRMKIHYQKR
jgi:hypothetical protein